MACPGLSSQGAAPGQFAQRLSLQQLTVGLFAESTGHMGSTTQGLCTPGLGYVMLLDVGYGAAFSYGC